MISHGTEILKLWTKAALVLVEQLFFMVSKYDIIFLVTPMIAGMIAGVEHSCAPSVLSLSPKPPLPPIPFHRAEPSQPVN
jgi:hypothetical protein